MVGVAKRFALVVISILMLASASLAADWTIVAVTGPARLVNSDGVVRAVAPGEIMQEGWSLQTGPQSRVLVVSGAESMAIGPNSNVAVWEQGMRTLVVEERGTITYEIDRANERAFWVRTPILAAIVKGTVFTVSVSPDEGRVSVDRGGVEVRSLVGGGRVTIGAGQEAVIADDGEAIQVAAVEAGAPNNIGNNGNAGGPADKDDCRSGGWRDFGFPNQGQCVSSFGGGDDDDSGSGS